MKRAIVLAFAAVLAVAVWAWADVDIFVHGGGSGSVIISEHLYTPGGEIHEYFEAYGDWNFYKDLWIYVGPDYGSITEWKSFEVDGFVNFYESAWLYSPPFDPDYFEVGAFAEVFGEGYVFFDKFVNMWFDGYWWEAGLYQEVYVEGYFLDGAVSTGHTGWTDSYWYIDQDYFIDIWAPLINDHVWQTAFLYPPESNYFGVDAWFYYEPFQIYSVVDDYIW